MTSTLASQLIVVLIVCAAAGYVGLVVMRALRSLRRREKGSPRGRRVGGRGVVLAEESSVRDAELGCCVELDAGRGHAALGLVGVLEVGREDGLLDDADDGHHQGAQTTFGEPCRPTTRWSRRA